MLVMTKRCLDIVLMRRFLCLITSACAVVGTEWSSDSCGGEVISHNKMLCVRLKRHQRGFAIFGWIEVTPKLNENVCGFID